MKKKHVLLYTILLAAGLQSCSKKDFLAAKPDRSLTVPATLHDYQALLDNDAFMNGSTSIGLTPQMGEMAADNYYIPDADYNTRYKPVYQNIYSWAKQLYAADDLVFDWQFPYRSVFYSNVVLDGLAQLAAERVPADAYNNVLGSALFYRAHLFYHLAQVFAPPYNRQTAASDWGIPLRLTSSVGEQMKRATVQQTYQQVLAELHGAAGLLPQTPLYKTRPSRVAAWGLLARVHQTMQQYDSALFYADRYLQVQNTLLDYNTLNAAPTFSFPRFNTEVTISFNGANGEVNPLRPGRNRVNSELYHSYDADDLRKTLFFKPSAGSFTFNGSYDGTSNLFTGIATNELYLIRAECQARSGNTAAALDDLNTLLSTRWKAGTFAPRMAATAGEALDIILAERRKELCFRGLRWTDLRRLNAEGRNITLTRTVNGQVYTLPPNDPRYTFPVPQGVLAFNPDMPQNPR